MNLTPRQVNLKRLLTEMSKPGPMPDFLYIEHPASIWVMELPVTAYTADMTGRVAAFWFLSNERAQPKLSTSGKA